MSRVTIKTLAQQLGLSIATVSKALKDSYEISAVTKKKVLDLAADLNYTPNPYASSLRKQSSKTIAVILPEVADNFFSLAINGIQEVASSRNYHVLIYLSHEKTAIEKEVVKHCMSGRVDGVLISVSNETCDSTHFSMLEAGKIPLVFFDRDFEGYAAPKVVTNDYECGRLAARHLIQRGCIRPLLLSSSTALSICNKRAAGFTDFLKEKKLPSDDAVRLIKGNDSRSIMRQLKRILQSTPSPDGIVATVERLAIHAYSVCKTEKILIPRDLKIIAFSTLETAPLLSPSLTTITQPAFEIGKNAAELLVNLIEKNRGAVPRDYMMTLASGLIKREATL
ncbi:LacI family DNA-binding transcriptional regulator [Niabella terrae]